MSWCSPCDEPPDARFGVEASDALDRRARLRLVRGAAELREPDRLFLQLRPGKRIPRISFGCFDARRADPAAGGAHLDLADPAPRIGGVDLLVAHHPHALAKCGHARIDQRVLLEVLEAGLAVHGDE